MRLKSVTFIIALFALGGCASVDARPPVKHEAMVVAADKRAAAAGLEMIRQGGNATDAAIATMAVLGLVEPQSAGVGGGGFMLSFNNATNKIAAYDGREPTPASATPDYFFVDGKALPRGQAMASGLSTGAPSLIAMLKLAHQRDGKLPWATLFEPAIKLAEEGFEVSPRLNQSIAGMAARSALKEDPFVATYLFTPDGAPLPVGFVRKNQDYANTLKAIAAQGPKALQDGPIADAILATVHRDPRPGKLTKADLANPKPRRLEAICKEYRVYKVCGMPPPTSGGVAVLDILELYERARPKPVGANNEDDWAAYFWASRIAYTDRDYYLADDTYVPVPTKGLLADDYLDKRAAIIDLGKPAPAVITPGDPAAPDKKGPMLGRWGGVDSAADNGTTHFSIVDRDGNAIALTASVEAPFGSQRMAAGFFLNNQLTDFSLQPTIGGKPVANAVAGGKKPRSSMSPTLVFTRDGDFHAAIGSPGGSSIIGYVSKTLIGVLDWNLSMQEAIDMANVVASGPRVRVEGARFPSGAAAVLTARGWQIAPVAGENSGLNGILMTPDGPTGASDPRREGVALKE
jgi:gamma-glutamyltranspeptidase/glutathione hydrolase